MRIAIVEDHHALRQMLVDALAGEGLDVTGVSCGEDLDELMASTTIDLIVLDVNLPSETGFEIATRIRAADPMINICILSARTSDEDRIRGYASGADFYMGKPVSTGELTLMIKAAQRRIETSQSDADLLLDMTTMKLHVSGSELDLGKLDMLLLKALAFAPDRQLPYWRLLEVTERDACAKSKSQLEIQILRLRRKLAEVGIATDFIKVIRGEGYKLTQPLRIKG